MSVLVPKAGEFQSTPAVADRRNVALVLDVFGLDKFQSTPAVADRRNAQRLTWLTSKRSFNPLRPLPTGETPDLGIMPDLDKFQSTPAVADRRNYNPALNCPVVNVSIHSGRCRPEKQ